jgi:CTP synthase
LKDLPETKIAIVGKYSEFKDAYTSLIKALEYSSIEAKIHLNLVFLNSEDLELSSSQYSKTL